MSIYKDVSGESLTMFFYPLIVLRSINLSWWLEMDYLYKFYDVCLISFMCNKNSCLFCKYFDYILTRFFLYSLGFIYLHSWVWSTKIKIFQGSFLIFSVSFKKKYLRFDLVKNVTYTYWIRWDKIVCSHSQI